MENTVSGGKSVLSSSWRQLVSASSSVKHKVWRRAAWSIGECQNLSVFYMNVGREKQMLKKTKDLIGGHIDHALSCVCVCVWGLVWLHYYFRCVFFFLSDIRVGLFFPLTRCCVFPRVLSILPDVSWHAVWLPFDFNLSVCVSVWMCVCVSVTAVWIRLSRSGHSHATVWAFDKRLTRADGCDFASVKMLHPYLSFLIVYLSHTHVNTPIIMASDGAERRLSHAACLHRLANAIHQY